MKLRFIRSVGAGNTFYIAFGDSSGLQGWLDLIKNRSRPDLSAKWEKGVDGLVYLMPSESPDRYSWYFLNADGSDADMCGNAVRCVGAFLNEKKLFQGPSLELQTKTGQVIIRKSNSEGIFEATIPLVPKGQQMKFEDLNLSAYFVNTGVPHLVVESQPQIELARTLRKDPRLGSGGANITFVQPDVNELKAVTFERGVENYTLACGTGAIAVAEWFRQNKKENSARIEMPGGRLEVTWNEQGFPVLKGQALIEPNDTLEVNI